MEISVPFSMVICSKRNSGKSFLCKHLLQMFMMNNTLFDYIVLFSSTAHLTKDFECLYVFTDIIWGTKLLSLPLSLSPP